MGQLLRVLDLSDGEDRVVMELRDEQAAQPLGSHPDGLVQIVTDREPGIGMGHFRAAPHLTIHDLEGKPVADMGPGEFADLHPDGRALVWPLPMGAQTCEDPCPPPPSHIVTAPLDAPGEARILGTVDEVKGVWWLDSERVLVEQAGNRSVIITPDGATAPGPEGRVRHVAAKAGLALMADDDLHSLWLTAAGAEPAWRLDLAPARADGVVTTDGGRALVQVVKAKPDGTAEMRLLLVDAAGTETPLDEPRVDGNLMWSNDDSAFAYRRTTRKGDGFELAVCESDLSGCNDVLSWRQGVDVLALTIKEEPS